MIGKWVVAGLGGFVLAACTDGAARVARVASPPASTPAASGRIVISTHGSTVAFPARVAAASSPKAQLDRTGGAAGVAGATLPLVKLTGNPAALLAPPNAYRRVVSFTDPDGARHHVVALYDRTGGPPRVIQHYVGSSLTRVTAMRWMRTGTGWMTERILSREIRGDSLVFEAEAKLDATAAATGGRARRVVALLAAGVARAMAPRDAVAQYYFSECWKEYTDYWKATAALTSAILAIEIGLESGLGATAMNALYFTYTTTLAWAIIAEMNLFNCVQNQRELDRSTSGTTSDGSSSASGSEDSYDWECLEGSYAAYCQTAFTL